MISPNKYSEQKALHAKCLAILEAIDEFVRRLNSAEDHLNRFEAADRWAPIRLMNTERDLQHRVAVLRHTVERMQGYYERTSKKVCKAMAGSPVYPTYPYFDIEALAAMQNKLRESGFSGFLQCLVEPIDNTKIDLFHGTDTQTTNQNIPGYC